MQSIFRIQLGTRVPRFKPIQIKTAREKLRKGRGLLEKHQCHVVQVPDSGLLVILLGVNHFEIESVKAVERIIQGVCPDAVCVELCEPRVRSAGLREEGRRIRGSSKASLRKDLADELRKQSSDGVRASESGAEMKMAFLEAYRLLKPIHLVDRDILDTVQRFRAARAAGLWPLLHRRLPRLAEVLSRKHLGWTVRTAGRGRAVPESCMLRMFHRGQIQLPWAMRREVLEAAQEMRDINGGEKMVPLESLERLFDRQRIEEHMLGGHVPMPHELRHWLGPESDLDVVTRVIGFERDAIIARNIREIDNESVEYAPHGLNGPLVLAAVGKAHVQGVAHHLKLPLSELHEIIADFSDDGEAFMNIYDDI
mmetsp:Transcript_21985/g.48309  ORF Transcript_21985/g.48309 Transcript_21985/m.48309 type:complete len:367 (+) Transcript_21985:33-1133(+)